MLIDAWHPSAQEEVVHDNNDISINVIFRFGCSNHNLMLLTLCLFSACLTAYANSCFDGFKKESAYLNLSSNLPSHGFVT